MSRKKQQQNTADFGFRQVDADKKAGLVHGVFSSVASKYDLMNDLMSGGLHRVWKLLFVSQVKLQDGMHVLDLAGGTGDIAFKLLERARKEGKKIRVTVADINEAMLEEGRSRAVDRNLIEGIEFQVADAENLPFEAESFDACTMAFGIRNVTRKDRALEEISRVLSAPGQFLCLEFAPVEIPVLKQIYDAYSFNVIPLVGQVVANDRDSYQYLVESIRQFPRPEAFKSMIENAGFAQVSFRSHTGGVVNVHEGWKG